MIATKELSGYLDEYLEEKQEIKNLTSETIKKQTFNINTIYSNPVRVLNINALIKINTNKSPHKRRSLFLGKRKQKLFLINIIINKNKHNI